MGRAGRPGKQAGRQKAKIKPRIRRASFHVPCFDKSASSGKALFFIVAFCSDVPKITLRQPVAERTNGTPSVDHRARQQQQQQQRQQGRTVGCRKWGPRKKEAALMNERINTRPRRQPQQLLGSVLLNGKIRRHTTSRKVGIVSTRSRASRTTAATQLQLLH